MHHPRNIHEIEMWLPGWIKNKKVTCATISPKTVNPRGTQKKKKYKDNPMFIVATTLDVASPLCMSLCMYEREREREREREGGREGGEGGKRQAGFYHSRSQQAGQTDLISPFPNKKRNHTQVQSLFLIFFFLKLRFTSLALCVAWLGQEGGHPRKGRSLLSKRSLPHPYPPRT